MSSQVIPRQRVRLAFDVNSHDFALDQMTGGTPKIWRGTDVRFELAGFWGVPTDANSDVIDITNIASMTVDIKPYADRDGDDVLPQKTTSTFYTLKKTEWEAYSNCHAYVDFAYTETSPTLSGDSTDYWMVVSVATNESPGTFITWGVTKLTVEEDGSGTGTTPDPDDPTYYTATQTDAAIAAAKYDTIKIGCPDDGYYYKVQVRIIDGVKHLVIGDEQCS